MRDEARLSDPPRLLIVNADDLGLHEDINRGIFQAHVDGIVTSASIVACGDAFVDAAATAQQCPSLDVGVHLTLIEERPLCPAKDIPTLLGPDDRFLPSHRHLTARILAGAVSVPEIRLELRAQIERVIATGRHPSHLDGHQHVHLLPSIWGVTTELAREYGIQWIRVPRFTRPFAGVRSPIDVVFRLGLNTLSAMRRRRWSRPERVIQTPGLHLSGRLREADLFEIVGDLQPGISEIVAHPGVGTPALTARYGWGYQWSTELAALTSSRITAFLRSSGVKLTRYSECA
jgi:predicted glycoside hydrolase/deacetylase ChbG (UPF0249 family)